MITEDYVSLETAKLLSTKGFKGEFHKHYWGYEPGKEFLTEGYFNPEYDYPAPTLQVAIKWLREVHDIILSIYYCDKAWQAEYYGKDESIIIGCEYKTYEEACESAIKYALKNLI